MPKLKKYRGGARKGDKLNPTGKGGFGDHPENAWRHGRPPGTIQYPDLLRRLMKLTMTEVERIARDPAEPAVNRIAAKQVLAAMAVKDPRHTENLIDRVEGRPTQTVKSEHTGVLPTMHITIDEPATNTDQPGPGAADPAPRPQGSS